MSIPSDYLNQIVTGDARVLAERIPDNSIDLIFTDPVYSERGLYDLLAAIALRVLKPSGAVLCWSNGKWHRENANWLEAAGLTYRYDFGNVMVGGPQPMNGHIISKTNRVMWFDVNRTSKMIGYLADGMITATEKTTGWKWGKSPRFTTDAIIAFSRPDAVVFDPFCGLGTVPAMAKVIHRNYIGFELDTARAASARMRIAHTQAIHPVFLEQQQTLVSMI